MSNRAQAGGGRRRYVHVMGILSRAASVTAALALVAVPSAAHAADRATKERIVAVVSFCAEALCQPLDEMPNDTAMLYRWTAQDATVVRICGQHKAFTHTWRVAFCTGQMPVRTAPDYRDAEGGIVDRGRHALGETLIGSGVTPS